MLAAGCRSAGIAVAGLLLAGLLVPVKVAGAQTISDIAFRDRLIADQEALLERLPLPVLR